MTATRPNRRHILKKAGALGALAALFSPSVALAQTTTENQIGTFTSRRAFRATER